MITKEQLLKLHKSPIERMEHHIDSVILRCAKKGETFQKNITDQSQIDLRIGYAPGVEIKINGEVLSYKLDPKTVMTQNITIQNKKEEKSS